MLCRAWEMSEEVRQQAHAERGWRFWWPTTRRGLLRRAPPARQAQAHGAQVTRGGKRVRLGYFVTAVVVKEEESFDGRPKRQRMK